MKVALGCDHAGFVLKAEVQAVLEELGHEVLDFGTDSLAPVDYVDYATPVARAVAEGRAELGVLICGTGIGMCIAANKIPGAYAARVEECYSARMARLHNAANILCLGGRTIGAGLAREIVQVFVTTTPSTEERHQCRRAKVQALEKRVRPEAP